MTEFTGSPRTGPTTGTPVDVSVVICAYTEERWHDFVAAVESVRAQTAPAREIVVVIDHNEPLLTRVQAWARDVVVVENAEVRGLSGARNSGVAAARGGIIAFLDDDAVAADDWLEHLLAGYDEPRVLGVGGAIEPLWKDARPRWFPVEFQWVVGCTYRGMPETTATVRNLIGANMSVRRAVFEGVGGFHAGVGRIGALPVGCEETELCIRGLQRWPMGAWRYEPRARVGHRVLGRRAGWDYFRSRCYAEGRSKAVVSRLVGSGDGLASERTYTLRTLPAGVVDGLSAALHGDPSGLARAGAIIGGLAITTAGYVAGTAAARRSRDGTGNVAHEQTKSHRAAGVGRQGRDEDAMNPWLEFNIHDRAAIRVARDAPTALLLRDMFAPFLAEGLGHYDLTITGRPEPLVDVAHGETEYNYTETAVQINATDVQILLEEGGFRLNGQRELLVSALPLIDRILVKRDVAMIHAATVDYGGRGICMPAWGGTGKTSTIAKLLKLDGVAFMGDDWAFLADDGRLLGYAKPMFIKPHHRRIYPHLFERRRKPLIPTRLSRPLGRLTTMVHPVITRYPRLARATRKWSPEHMMVTPRAAFPNAAISTSAPLAIAVFVERHEGTKPVLVEKDRSWMVSRLIGNFHAEITPHSQGVITALAATGLVPIERYFGDKAAVLERGLVGTPAFLLQVPQAYSPDQASDVIVAHLQEALARTDVDASTPAARS
ncbi:MAG: hypothetical protein AVDCRST_MAG19-323 [uncultured Thermomicrobiales bacterium]|uniref:Glycosyltransferase 2-like domain-containing protein n=1 Tax=uncultured Thermomicrobiales bacterium TaxID=1645740 RepID=A0A6J4UD59_9BACT|nr:MAG: hypothetical protein AVDCRST_MAG19-323 [uncultured Thermomicrobiales bacterium]